MALYSDRGMLWDVKISGNVRLEMRFQDVYNSFVFFLNSVPDSGFYNDIRSGLAGDEGQLMDQIFGIDHARSCIFGWSFSCRSYCKLSYLLIVLLLVDHVQVLSHHPLEALV